MDSPEAIAEIEDVPRPRPRELVRAGLYPPRMRIRRPSEIVASYAASTAATATARFCLGRVPLGAEPLAGFFPDFAVDRWPARAAGKGMTRVALGEGLLRGPPRSRTTSPWLSTLALEVAGPACPP